MDTASSPGTARTRFAAVRRFAARLAVLVVLLSCWGSIALFGAR